VTDVDVAIEVVAAGANVVRRRYGRDLARTAKGGGDFATSADIEAEAAMLAVLASKRPADGILAEESGSHAGSDGGARVWLIDPLCGTLNYAARMPIVAVNAAVRDGNRLLAAAVADPFSSETFWTDGRASHVRAGGRDTPLAPTAASRLVDLNLDPPFPSAPGFLAATLAGDSRFLDAFRPRVVSTSLALAWVATGQRAAYVTDGVPRDSVHFAAGIAICEAAGCVVTDLFGAPRGGGPTGLLAAADSETHATLLGLTRAVGSPA
jgi:myo-inositol-1(or 4)-monophosphatase